MAKSLLYLGGYTQTIIVVNASGLYQNFTVTASIASLAALCSATASSSSLENEQRSGAAHRLNNGKTL